MYNLLLIIFSICLGIVINELITLSNLKNSEGIKNILLALSMLVVFLGVCSLLIYVVTYKLMFEIFIPWISTELEGIS